MLVRNHHFLPGTERERKQLLSHKGPGALKRVWCQDNTILFSYEWFIEVK